MYGKSSVHIDISTENLSRLKAYCLFCQRELQIAFPAMKGQTGLDLVIESMRI